MQIFACFLLDISVEKLVKKPTLHTPKLILFELNNESFQLIYLPYFSICGHVKHHGISWHKHRYLAIVKNSIGL